MGIMRFARQAGWILGFATPGMAPALKYHRIDGMVCQLHEPTDPELVAATRRMKVPKVELSNHVPSMHVPRVMPDFAGAGRLAAEHFLNNGFRNFTYVGSRRRGTQPNSIYRGLRQALSEQGLNLASVFYDKSTANRPCTDLFDEAYRLAWHRQIAAELARWPHPVAVVCREFSAALDVFDACRGANLLIPEEVALVTWAQDPEESELTEIPISSLIMDYERQGYEAAAALDRLMRGQRVPALTLIPPKPLLVRESSDVVAVPNVTVARALNFINHNLDDPALGLPRLVAALGVSRTHLHRLFQQCFHCSVAKHIKEKRAQKAMKMIETTRLPIKEIARACGYSSGVHLSRTLARLTGRTPLACRKGLSEDGISLRPS